MLHFEGAPSVLILALGGKLSRKVMSISPPLEGMMNEESTLLARFSLEWDRGLDRVEGMDEAGILMLICKK